MKVLFSMRHLGSLRIFESVVRQLADESHKILILAHRRDDAELGSAPDTMFADLPQIVGAGKRRNQTPGWSLQGLFGSGSTTCVISNRPTRMPRIPDRDAKIHGRKY